MDGWQLEADSAEAYERYLAPAFRPWAADLVARAGVRRGHRVLDVACGTGVVAREAAAALDGSGTVAGLDRNEGMLRVARHASRDVRPPVEWRTGNAAELPWPDRSFDVVLCEQALQFFADPVAAAREMRRVLAPGGTAGVTVCRAVAYSPTYAALADALEAHASPEAAALMRSPFCAWTVEDLRGIFRQAGFAHVAITIQAASLRYPSPAEMLRREAASSPLAAHLAGLDPAARDALVRDLEVRLADHRDDEGVLCPLETSVVLARP
jgi:ubiquinone/menaquinone biosynthesis C-methylase UbiE